MPTSCFCESTELMIQTRVVQAVGITPEFLSAYIIFVKFPKPFEFFSLLERERSKIASKKMVCCQGFTQENK